jgi:hypothetical protein
VDAAIGDRDPDAVDAGLAFVNIHANAAAPLLHGAEGGAGYEYAGKSYAGRFAHVPGFNNCVGCHDAHSLRLPADNCGACHLGATSTASLQKVRVSNLDYDGNGDATEGVAQEIDALRERLLETMQRYAAEQTGGGKLTYSKNYPYFLGADKQPFAQWTPRLLRAAYNYHVVTKGSGAFAHNPGYTLQLLYDSIEDLGGDLGGAVRPAAR